MLKFWKEKGKLNFLPNERVERRGVFVGFPMKSFSFLKKKNCDIEMVSGRKINAHPALDRK